MWKIVLLLCILFLNSSVLANEVMLQCNWEQSSHAGYSGRFLKRETRSEIFILKDNKVFTPQGNSIPAEITNNEIKIILDNSDAKAKIIETFTINRITGNIDYKEDYQSKSFLSRFEAITTGNVSCNVISNMKKF